MPVPMSSPSTAGSLLWLLGLAVAAFAVAWVFGNRWRLARTGYIAVLAVVTAALSAGYLAWLDVDVSETLTHNWGWGLLAAAVIGLVLAFGISRAPSTEHRSGGPLLGAFVWEGLVYGIAEGVLLSALPALMAWQLAEAEGWSSPVQWTSAMVASIVVIVVHHLGYAEFRNRMLVPVSIGCGLLTLGYLITASPLAAAFGHVVMHVGAVAHGNELPPEQHTETPTPAGRPRVTI